MIQKAIFLLSLTLCLASCQKQQSTATFNLVVGPEVKNIYIDPAADSLIVWAVNDLADDIQTMTGRRPKIIATTSPAKKPGVYIGQFESELFNPYKKQLLKDSLENEWEAFQIHTNQLQLLIAGSDVRGTVYGVFEVAEQLGISPWKWWADVTPPKSEQVALDLPFNGIFEKPSVKYRGIFLNDEDWGLQPWAAKTFEPETGDIGPKTYEKIFQLLLRLKANTIWPAMHPCTTAFYKIPGNKETAEKYRIVVGSSHAEPMLRNNVDEWDHDSMGEYNFVENREGVIQYWKERVKQVKEGENIFSVGMRGIHDSGMRGGESTEDQVEILEDIISVQRNMLEEIKGQPAKTFPQALVPYKEVLYLYNAGMEVPEDITLIWCDDNYGYIRRLSNEEEQKRSGGSGVYYHLSYWGRPHDYLWLSSTQPALIWTEINRAYANGARDIWIANVGDIKPAEYNMELFLDMAWDINSISNNNIPAHLQGWAKREFGKDNASEVAQIMQEYYRLAFLRKPEFMGWSQTERTTPVYPTAFEGDQLHNRIQAYSNLTQKVDMLKTQLPPEKLDAWFQLVEYPVKCAAWMNHKFLYAKLAMEANSDEEHQKFANLSKSAFQKIEAFTKTYNTGIADGKWNHMMSMEPRGLPVYEYPERIISQYPVEKQEQAFGKEPVFIQAHEFDQTENAKGFRWEKINGLGYSGGAMTLIPLTHTYFEEKQPSLIYNIKTAETGAFELQVRCLPTHANNFDHQLTIQIDNQEPQTFDLNTKGRSEDWKTNVLRNSQIVRFNGYFDESGAHTVRLSVNQTGIIIDQMAINFEPKKEFYEIPVN